MLMVLPSGMPKLTTVRDAPSASVQRMFEGRAAALEQVVKPIMKGSSMPLTKRITGILTTNLTSGRNMKQYRMAQPAYISRMTLPRGSSTARPCLVTV